MSFPSMIPTCRRCFGEVTMRMLYTGRGRTGGGYRRVPNPCSTCEFREVQLPMIERARRRA